MKIEKEKEKRKRKKKKKKKKKNTQNHVKDISKIEIGQKKGEKKQNTATVVNRPARYYQKKVYNYEKVHTLQK